MFAFAAEKSERCSGDESEHNRRSVSVERRSFGNTWSLASEFVPQHGPEKSECSSGDESDKNRASVSVERFGTRNAWTGLEDFVPEVPIETLPLGAQDAARALV